MGSEGELLVDHAHAEGAGVERPRRLVGRGREGHLARVRRVGARQHLHKRALAGAVFAYEGEDLAGGESEIYALQRLGGAEGFGHAAHGEKRGGGGGSGHALLGDAGRRRIRTGGAVGCGLLDVGLGLHRHAGVDVGVDGLAVEMVD